MLAAFIASRFGQGSKLHAHDLAAPGQQLMVQRNLHRADIGARAAQAAGVRQAVVVLGIAQRPQDRADRAGNRVRGSCGRRCGDRPGRCSCTRRSGCS